ncbi:MAG: hypothetical protein DHS20C13_03470 [Thermodesulfobacteriota bacterium]|nr:MAG: hypothetical protein DHS20C13_03470 [Thermodesulfobacteriota bacterium]
MLLKIILFAIFATLSTNAFGQRPFECSRLFYQVFSSEGQLLKYDIERNIFEIEPNNAGRRINATGYRQKDNFAYGVTFTRDDLQLVRVSANGSVEELGTIAGLSSVPLYPVGDFGGDDLLYVNAGGTSNVFNIIHAIDVDTVEVVNSINIAGSNFGISDIAYNPVDGLFYAVTQNIGASQVPAQTLIAIDIETGTFEERGLTGLEANGVFGSMYADARGNVYGSDRTGEGIFYQLNTQTGEATSIGKTLPEGLTASIDGFSCSANPGPFAPPLPNPIPTISQWGLITLAAILGIAGLLVIRRKKLSA